MPITRGSTKGSDVNSNFALLRLAVCGACSEVDAEVEAGGLLLSAHPFLLCM